MNKEANINNQNNSSKVTLEDKIKNYMEKHKTLVIIIELILVAIVIFLIYNFNSNTVKPNNDNQSSGFPKCNNKTEPSYKITLNTVGGNLLESLTVNKVTSVGIIPTPKKTNNTFMGWYYDALYTKKVEIKTLKDIERDEYIDNQGCIQYKDITLYARWSIKTELSNEELTTQLNELMVERNYNEYAIKVIKSFIKDYQKLFTNRQIYDLFDKIKSVTLNPYDPKQPDLSMNNRAYNTGGNIVVNCFKGELDNNKNWAGLKWLLTHEFMHSLGYFPSDYTEGSYDSSIVTRNALLDEGFADSIANFVRGISDNSKYAIKKQNNFKMYWINSNYKVEQDRDATHAYTISGNIVSIFKYIGCYDALIDTVIDSNFKPLKTCMTNNVKNGEQYFDDLFKTINNIYLYIGYPSKFYTKTELLEKYKYPYNPELIKFIENNDFYDIMIEYAKLAAEIMNNKTDKTYTVCDFYKSSVIMYSTGSNKYTSNVKCK